MGLKFTIAPTWRDVRGRFARAEDELLKVRRQELRLGGRKLVAIARDEAPKKSGKFARGIGFKTFKRGDRLVLSVHTPQPLGKFIQEGTKRHDIPKPKDSLSYPLKFFWPKFGRVVFFRWVDHPGTKPNPFMKRAARRFEPIGKTMLNKMATRYVQEVTR